MSRFLTIVAAAFALASGINGVANAATYTYSTLSYTPDPADPNPFGNRPTGFSYSTSAVSINDSSQIIDYFPALGSSPYIDYKGELTFLGFGPKIQNYDQALAINNKGQVTGYYEAGTSYVTCGTDFYCDVHDLESRIAFLGGATLPINSAYPNPIPDIVPHGINDVGQIVGTIDAAYPQANAHGSFLYSTGAFTTLTIPGAAPGIGGPDAGPGGQSGGDVTATGINDAGQIVGTYSDGTNTYGFEDTGGVIALVTMQGAIPGTTAPNGISNTGVITGTFSDASGTHGFVDDHGAFTTLDVAAADVFVPPGDTIADTFAEGINSAGDVVGTYEVFNPDPLPGFANLTGYAFLATPAVAVPEPGSAALLGAGLAALGLTVRRRTRA